MSPTMQEIFESGDDQSLLKILRCHPDPRIRIDAARFLLRLQKPESIEGIIRSVLADPDSEVRTASNNVLEQFVGETEARLALSAYGVVDGVMDYEMDAAKTLVEDQDDSEPEPEAEEIAYSEVPGEFLDFTIEDRNFNWDPDALEPLISILQDDNHPERQMKALRIIADHPTSAGIDALSMVALWSENLLVKNAANRVLQSMYGEETGRLLDEYRASRFSDESDEEDEEIFVEISQPPTGQAPSDRGNMPVMQAIEPEGLNARALFLLMAVLFIGAALLVYWFFLR